MFARLGRLVTERPARIAAGAALLAVVAALFGGRVADSLKPFGFDDPHAETQRAERAIERASGVNPNVALVALLPADPAAVARAAAELRREPAVTRTVTYFQTHDPALLSKDGRTTYVAAFFRPLSDEAQADAAERIRQRFAGERDVLLGGGAVSYREIEDVVSEDLTRAELLAFPLLFLLAFWVFRGVVAALLPPLVGGLSILLTFLGMRLLTDVTDLSIFALNLVTGLGLGLAIDWSLLVVSRYREESARAPGREALLRTLDSAGRTVFYSSLTVAAALASMLVFPQRFLYSMGVGGVLIALVGGAVSLVVLPAVLALLGTRVNALAPRRWQRTIARPTEAGGWYRFSRFVMRHPGRIAAGSAALLVALGLPFLGIRLTTADARVLPTSSSARRVDTALRRDFPRNRTSPIFLAVEGGDAGAARGFASRLRDLPGVVAVRPPQRLGPSAWKIEVISAHDYLADESQDLVHEIRKLPAPFDVKVGGDSAWFVDQKASLAERLPFAVAILALTTLVVLFLMTASIVLPLKALVMNALTVSAAFGFLVFVFQEGRLESVLRYTGSSALDFTQPILLAAIVFGLSTDYGVFLLSRIKEARDRGAPDREAVAIGLERTGRIVTAAALLFCVAVGAFATSRVVFIKELGVGIAFAVLIDASVVRALLVPSLMRLLGRWNWWAPGPLRRLHRRVGLSET